MERKTTFAFYLGVIVLAGCKGGGTSGGAGSSGKIVGAWQGTQPNLMNNAKTSDGKSIGKLPDIQVSLTLNSNGTYTSRYGTGQLASQDDGTFTYDESAKQLTLKVEKSTIAGQDMKMPSFGGTAEPVTWKSDNEILVKSFLGEMDLKRK